MDKTKPRNFRTTDQTDKVDDFFQKSIVYGFGQFGWTKSFQKIFGHGVRQVATVLNKHLDLRPGLFWKFCSNSHEEVFGLWARKKLLRWTKSFHKIFALGARQVASSKQKHLGLGPGYQLKNFVPIILNKYLDFVAVKNQFEC